MTGQDEINAFVGRSAELSILNGLLEGLKSGRGAAILICGNSGIGKTRLVKEVCRRNSAVTSWASSTCVRGSSIPFGPLFDILEGIGVELEPLNQILSSGSSDAFAKLRLWRAIVAALEAQSKSRALALFIDNIHWADPETLELLSFIYERLEHIPIALLMTWTTEEPTAFATLETLTQRVTQGVIKKIDIEKLSSGDACALASSILAQSTAKLSQERVASILSQADGNPLFLTELLRDAIELHGAGVPDCAKIMAEARLRQFDPVTQRIVLVASAFGDRVRSEQLADVLGFSSDEVEARLQEACLSRLMTEESEGVYGFSHALLREAIYNQFTAAFAKVTHANIARTLEREKHTEASALAAIASHWRHAGAENKAIEYDLAAGDAAMKASRFGIAAVSYERALGSASSVGVVDEMEIASKLGEALMLGSHPSKAAVYYGLAVERSGRDLVKLVHNSTGLARAYHESGHALRALEVIKTLSGSLKNDRLPDELFLLAALCEFNITQRIDGPWLGGAIRHLDQFSSRVQGKVRMLMATNYFRSGEAEAGEKLFNEVCNEAAACGNDQLLAQVLLAKTDQLVIIGRVKDALEACARAYKVALAKGSSSGALTRMTEVFSYCAYAYELTRAGKFREARVALDKIGDVMFDATIERVVAYASMMRVVALGGGQMPYQVSTGLESRLIELARETGHSDTISAVSEALSLWYRSRGSMEAARQVLHVALEVADLRESHELLLLIGEFGEWADVPKARRLLEIGLARSVLQKKIGYSNLFEAFIYQRQGKRASAQRRARRASEALENLGEKVRFAQALEISGQRREARNLAIAMGMESVASYGRKVRRERVGPLTMRQEQLHRLVVQGFSNAEIARELGISEGTVRVHLTEIFRRLSVRSRSQLMASANGSGQKYMRNLIFR